jgi:hypothetical protein
MRPAYSGGAACFDCDATPASSPAARGVHAGGRGVLRLLVAADRSLLAADSPRYDGAMVNSRRDLPAGLGKGERPERSNGPIRSRSPPNALWRDGDARERARPRRKAVALTVASARRRYNNR